MRTSNTILRRFFAAYAEELGKAMAQVTALSVGTMLALLLSQIAR